MKRKPKVGDVVSSKKFASYSRADISDALFEVIESGNHTYHINDWDTETCWRVEVRRLKHSGEENRRGMTFDFALVSSGEGITQKDLKLVGKMVSHLVRSKES